MQRAAVASSASSSACPERAIPPSTRSPSPARCGDDHEGLVTHDELDWAPIAGPGRPFLNLMTARLESAARGAPRPGRDGGSGRATGRGASSAIPEERPRPSSHRPSGSRARGRSSSASPCECPALLAHVREPRQPRPHVDVPFYNDRQVAVVEHVFGGDREHDGRGLPRGALLRRLRRAPPRPRRVTVERLLPLHSEREFPRNDADEGRNWACSRDDVTRRSTTRRSSRARSDVWGSPPLVRGLFTLLGVAAAGFLIWLATSFDLEHDRRVLGRRWGSWPAPASCLGLSQLFGGWTKWGAPDHQPRRLPARVPSGADRRRRHPPRDAPDGRLEQGDDVAGWIQRPRDQRASRRT